ncbi:DUF1128 domain-containing protein [Pseudalkalibacillus sp. R45]|uniref:DUF1128 domain-containing protein n=1 Tax=Pseudalkalibacillus sp. R45 TaxID=3457433 RepID=UPI003FCD47B9
MSIHATMASKNGCRKDDLVNLNNKNEENLSYMIEQMQKQMQVVNTGVMRPEDFDVEQYDELKDLYDYVMKKNHFSVNETEGIIQELSELRKK